MEQMDSPNSRRIQAVNSRKSFYGIILLIFLGVTLYTLFGTGAGKTERLVFDKSGVIRLTDSLGMVSEIPFSAIELAEYIPDPDYGQPVPERGRTAKGIREGIWESAAYGEYVNSTEEKIRPCILIRDASTIYLINYENENSTLKISESLQSFIVK